MKAILKKPKLSEAFKVMQPLPALAGIPPVDVHRAAAPQFDATWDVAEASQNPACAAALDAAENGARKEGRRLSAMTTLAGVVQSRETVAGLRSNGDVSQWRESD